jgi:threonylcarbamoyladenosine tRNA methylthiotransferase MtaB
MGHIFPFSPKRGTPAARMPLVAPGVVKERARRLREATARRRAAWLEGLIGTTQQVLVEREDGSGHAENFAPVTVRSSRSMVEAVSGWTQGQSQNGRRSQPSPTPPHQGNGALVGQIVPTIITAVSGDTLIGISA